MGLTDGANELELDNKTQKNLRSLGLSGSTDMRILAVKNAVHYNNAAHLLLDFLCNERSEQVLEQIEKSLVKIVEANSSKELIRKQLLEFINNSQPSPAQIATIQSVLKQL